MYIVLCTHGGLAAWFLRFVMWSRWSHAAIFDSSADIVWDTTFWQGGVRKTFAPEFFSKYRRYELRPVDWADVDGARAWLNAQVGKPYDWTALLSWVVRRDWQEDDAWFCSELVEACRSRFGRPVFREQASRITPRHQDMVV